jgi:Protein of unknown function (DUF2877)
MSAPGHAASRGGAPAGRPALPVPTELPVGCLGPAARDALRTGRRGRVLAVFRRSFYVALEGGGADAAALVCLGPPTLGAGPLNALCAPPPGGDWPAAGWDWPAAGWDWPAAGWDWPAAGWDWPAAGLAPGLPLAVEAGALRVGTRWRFDLSAARTWQPASIAPPAPAGLAAGAALLAAACAEPPRPRGLGRLLPALLGQGGAPPDASGLEAALLRQGWLAARALQGWLARMEQGGPVDEPPAALPALLGLGPGLTPAGDDLLGGALLALHALGRQRPAQRLAARLLPAAGTRTGRISAAHLACAARGWGTEALHAALAALAAGDAPALGAALRAPDAIGHSSGWDALAGAAAVWAALAGPANSPAAP